MKKLMFIISALAFLTACTPKVGSDGWCDMIKDKQAGDITSSEAADYAKHCVLK